MEHWVQDDSVYQKSEELKKTDFYNKLPLREKLFFNYHQIFSINYFGVTDNPRNVLNVFDEFLQIPYSEIEESRYQLFYSCIQLLIHNLKREWDQGLQLLRKNFNLINKLEAEPSTDIELLLILGLFYYVSSYFYEYDPNLANERLLIINKCGEYWDQLHIQFYDFKRLELKIHYYASKGSYEDVIAFGQYFVDYVTKNNFPKPIITAPLEFVAGMYVRSPNHDLKKALSMIDQCVELLEDTESDYDRITLYMKIFVYIRKGEIFYLTGDFDSALTSYQDVLNCYDLYYRKFGIELRYSRIYNNLGKTYNAIGKYELGLKYHLEELKFQTIYSHSSLARYSEDSIGYFTVCYYQLIKTCLLLNRMNEVTIYFTKLRDIFESLDKSDGWYNIVLIRYKLSDALILITNGNFKDVGKAKDLLKEVIKRGFNFELLVDSLIPLIEIIIQEYKTFRNQKSLKEFEELSNFINDLNKKNNSIYLQINFLVLQGKIAFINGEFEKSKSIYEESLEIAKKFDRLVLIKAIKSELEIVEKNILNDHIISTSNSRFDEIEFENYIKEAFQLIKTPNEE